MNVHCELQKSSTYILTSKAKLLLLQKHQVTTALG